MYKIDKLPAIQYLVKNDTILVLLFNSVLFMNKIGYLLCEYRPAILKYSRILTYYISL